MKTMKTIVYDFHSKKVLAIALTEASAHSMAECICYMQNSNSTYGLFGMMVTSEKEMVEGYDGADALAYFLGETVTVTRMEEPVIEIQKWDGDCYTTRACRVDDGAPAPGAIDPTTRCAAGKKEAKLEFNDALAGGRRTKIAVHSVQSIHAR